MLFKVSDPNARSLVEISITFHGQALSDALTSRSGCLWGLLRAAGFLALLYFALGWELTSHRYFPELALHPAILLLAYLALRGSLGVSLTLALLTGFLLDAGAACHPGIHTLPVVLATAAVILLRNTPHFPKEHSWYAAALAGATAHFLYAAVVLLVTWNATPQEILYQLAIGTLLAAFAYTPTLAFLLDLTGTTRK
jgi:hypothetical protein